MGVQQSKRARVAVPAYCVPDRTPKARCRCGGLIHLRPGETPEQAIARCPALPSGLYNKGVTVMEDLPTCAVCDQPIADDPHTHHEPDCPVVAASSDPSNTTALDQAMSECVCPPDALAHPGCCQVCAVIDTVLAP